MATTDSRNEGYRAFDDMTTWETGKAPDDRRRNTAKWTIVKKLVADVTWLQHEATREQRTHLHAYLHVIASSTAVPLQGRLAALDLGLSSGLLSRQGCHWYARKALLDLGDKPAASNLSLAVQWLRDHIMLDDISVQTVIGAALVHVDQDDRRKMLAMLLEDLVGPGSDTRLGLLGCLLAAWESVGAALRPIFSPSPASNGFATEASAITDLDRRGVRAGECGHAPQAHPERMTKALSDLRDTGAAWLRRLWQAPDVTIQLRLAYAALDLWAPAATIDTLASERTLIEERQETVALLLDIILGWSHDGDVIAAIDIDDELDLGLKLAILDICWRAGMVELYGRIARRLVRALPIMVVSLLPAQVTPLEAVARLEAVLDARVDKDLGPARGAIERLAFKQIGNLPLAQRHRAIRLLELLPDIGYSNTISSQRPSEIIAGIYHQFLERAYPSDALPASTILPPDGSLVIADAFGPLLREWTALRQAEASEAEAARGAAVQRENELLQQRVEDIDGEKAILRRDLEEARSLHKEHAAQDAAETSLPWIEQVYTLADDIDRLLAGDHGDYETLVWTREQVHDLLARHGVDVVGAIGERIHFDAALHEYVGPVGETYEWYEIMESGYILNNLDQAPTVLKRIPVRGVVS